MNLIAALLLVLCVLFGIAFFAGFIKRPPDPIRRLKDRFIALSRFSRAQAEAEILDRVEVLSERYPGKSYQWYLEWLVTDLERAKR